MTAPKYIAKTLTELLENPMVLDTLDRSKEIIPIAETAVGFWDYDLYTRKPSPAYDDYGIFSGTDLDLACFLYDLAERDAVIQLPHYKAATQRRQRKDQDVISTKDRHGRMIGLKANKDFFKFSVQILDENIVGEERVGDFRTFSLTDFDGEWYRGWDKIQFVPTRKENRFITENKLWSGNVIYFKNFIHPNRWTSFFGQYYVISKLVIDRLSEEIKNLNGQIKALQDEGILFPEGQGPSKHEYREPGEAKSIKVLSFQAKIYIPDIGFESEFPVIEKKQEALVQAYRKRKYLAKLKDKLTFMTRATEYAHSKNPDRIPAWIRGAKWENDFVEPGKRTKWQRLKLFQPKVGTHSVSILKRVYEKAARVSADY